MDEKRLLRWLTDERVDTKLRQELEGLCEEERQARFTGELTFGTGGMRALMGAGENRMNVHTVRRASFGLMQYVKESAAKENWRVAIGYDGRYDSARFAEETACVAAAAGVTAILYEAARPTPMLSYAVRANGCAAGVMITASHNPPEYNGYKVYDATGCQVLSDAAAAIEAAIRAVPDLLAIPVLSRAEAEEAGRLVLLGAEMDERYLREVNVLAQGRRPLAESDPIIVYTPLHGVGGSVVPTALLQAGFSAVHVVEQEAVLDPAFTHVDSPNPEDRSAYRGALRRAQEVGADLIMATDPDTDRVGVMARASDGTYEFFTGNEIGGMLLDTYLSQLEKEGALPARGVVVCTHVTSDFGEAIARAHACRTVRTLTGFKYIGAWINEHERGDAQDETFVFGYEESVGYLALPFVRDKDGVQASVLIAQMMADAKRAGETLPGRRARLFARYGYYRDRLLGFQFDGASGVSRMQALMGELRARPLAVANEGPIVTEDTLRGTRTHVGGAVEAIDLPMADVLKFTFQDGAWIAVRPSGTEPKLKVYLGVCKSSDDAAFARLDALEQAVRDRLKSYF